MRIFNCTKTGYKAVFPCMTLCWATQALVAEGQLYGK